MDQPFPWIVVALGASTLGLLVVGVSVVLRIRAGEPPPSLEERAALVPPPLPPLHQASWPWLPVAVADRRALAALRRGHG
ncbi:MAG: hypothetical protein H8E31_01800, partial [Planctomycetes bacterium]|nr:hypothetical protein [Planctomycetota bacterium]